MTIDPSFSPSQFPYPGLRPFSRSEYDIFFGRDENIDALLEQLEKTHFIAVLGRSGCGKSSLVRAGLLPSIEGGALGTYWLIAEFRPGVDSYAALADALLDNAKLKEYLSCFHEIESKEALQKKLIKTPAILRDFVQKNPFPDNSNLLIFIDQFEELFRNKQEGGGKRLEAFIALLLESCKHDNIYIVISMRSDFLDACARFYHLPEAVTQGGFLTPRLNPKQLKAAIEQPAIVHGDKVEPVLAERLLKEMEYDPDLLPLMQHALRYMWTLARKVPGESVLTLEYYERISGEGGKLPDVISKHAEDIYGEFTDEQKRIAEILFCSLTERTSEGKYVRRSAKLAADVADLAGVSCQQLINVAKEFQKQGRSFLTPLKPEKLNENSRLDISHESLIHYWKRLREWADDELESVNIYRGLQNAARRWETSKEAPEALWSGIELDVALKWFDSKNPTVVWAKTYDKDGGKQFDLSVKFLQLSEERKQQEKQKEKEAQKRQQQSEKMRQSLMITIIGFVVAIALAAWGWIEEEKAEEARQLSDLSLFKSQLSHANLLIQKENYKDAKRVLNRGRQNENAPPSYRHTRNLLVSYSKLMGGEPQQISRNTGAELYAIALSHDARLLAAGGENGTLALFRANDNTTFQRLRGHAGKVRAAVFHPQGEWLASAGDDGFIILWTLSRDAEEMLTIKNKRKWQASEEVWALAVSPDGYRIASAGDDNSVTLWEVKTGASSLSFKGHASGVSRLAFSPAENILAGASYDNTVYLWNTETGLLLHRLEAHTDDVESVSFSLNGKRLASSGRDKTIRLWAVNSGELLRTLRGHDDTVFDASIMDDGQHLVSGSSDSTLRFWDIESGATLQVLQGHKAGVTAVSVKGKNVFSAGRDGMMMRWRPSPSSLHIMDIASELASVSIAPDGGSVALGFADGSLRLYSLSEPDKLLWKSEKAHTRDVQRLAFSPDSTLLASASLDNTVKLWRIKQGIVQEQRMLFGHTDGISAAVFSPDGQMLVTSSYDGRVGLFTIGDKEPVFFVANEEKEINSVAFDATGTRLLSVGSNGVRLWDIKNNLPSLMENFAHIQDKVTWVDFSAKSQRFAIVGREPFINIYSFPDGELQHRLFGHKNTILRAEFSPDGQQLASVSGDATVRFWDLNNGNELFALRLPALPSPPAPLWDFDFRCTPKSCWIAVPLTSGKLVLYDLGLIYE